MNKKAWFSQASCNYLIDLLRNKTTVIYVGNIATHFKQDITTNQSTTNTNFNLRYLAPNYTNIMQHVDQHVGCFVQVYIHKKYIELILQQEKEDLIRVETKKIGIQKLEKK